MKYQEKLIQVIKELHKVSGFRISLHDTDFHEILGYPETKLGFCSCLQRCPEALACCRLSDAEAFHRVQQTGKTYLYTCRFGLTEAVSPLYHYGVLSGYLMMGQVRSGGDNSSAEIVNASRQFADEKELVPLIDKIPVVHSEMIESYVNIMMVCAEYITLSNVLQIFGRNLTELIHMYINVHYAEKLTLDILCEKFNCSKTTLLNSYSKAYGITIYRHIIEIRLKSAAEMLRTSNYPIGKVAASCGFEEQCYFSKVFARKYGCTPSAYRQAGRIV